MKVAKPFVLLLAFSFVIVTLVGCNPAPAPTGTKAGDKASKPVKPAGKPSANTTG